MLLLTVIEKTGERYNSNSKMGMESNQKTIGFVTNLTLSQAIQKLKDYERLYRDRYAGMYIEFSLIAVSIVEELTDELIDSARMDRIEDMN